MFVTIEGPEGSGKSSVTKEVVSRLEKEGYEVEYQIKNISDVEMNFTFGIEQVFSLITEELATGRSVKISGFASFEPYSKKERVGRNPKNGKTYPISSRTVLSFHASPNLKKQI